MKRSQRVVENLNQALHQLFAEQSHLYMLGEDILDPYGGAFKVSKGLSSLYPERILTTPISEEAILGIAGGLALCGEIAIVEMMFGDFIGLGFDQILNFATKSVAMYGRRLPMHLIIRCPVGGNRGYGPTHSQCLQKHFIGIPNLSLFELSPFHDNTALLRKLVALDHPCLLFEDKVLYTQKMYQPGIVDEVFGFDFLDAEQNVASISILDAPHIDCLLLVPGGLAYRALAAARKLLFEHERFCQIIVSSRLYPFDLAPLMALLEQANCICIAEESTAGGTWGAEVAHHIYSQLWSKLRQRVLLVHSMDSIIPSSLHLEKQVLVQDTDIYQAIKEATLA